MTALVSLSLTTDDREIAQMIADLGNASEVEIQARTLKGLRDLREEIGKLEQLGLIRRRRQAFRGGYGDALELTPAGYESIKAPGGA